MENTFVFVSFVLESSQNLKLLYQLSFNLPPNLAKVAYYFPVTKWDWVSNSPDGHITRMQHTMDARTILPCVVRQFATKICEENSKVTSQTQYLLCEKRLGILRCSSAYHGATFWQTHWEWNNTINPVNAQNLGPSSLAGGSPDSDSVCHFPDYHRAHYYWRLGTQVQHWASRDYLNSGKHSTTLIM